MTPARAHLLVSDLDRSIEFYSRIFGTGPNYANSRYAEWHSSCSGVQFTIQSRVASQSVDEPVDAACGA